MQPGPGVQDWVPLNIMLKGIKTVQCSAVQWWKLNFDSTRHRASAFNKCKKKV